jgi:GH25 family lysozyme M1 (1,4-beta-N-acetylmuramidase)
MATSHGIDVSSFQGTQNWAALAAGGLTFAFAKASEGQHSRDTRFSAHMAGILAAGLVPGAYHYGWPTQSPATEAANYIAAVKPYARTGFVHILDLERRSDGANYSGRTATQIKIWAHAWIGWVQQAFPGQRVGVYTSASDIAAGHLPDNSDFLWFPAYPSGGMTYAQAEARTRPAPSGKQPLFWQFTSTPLDRSIAYLSPAALRTWAAGDTTTPEADMPLTDADVTKIWAHKAPSPTAAAGTDPDRSMETYTRYADARHAQVMAAVGALTGMVTKLAASGGLTVEQATAAAEAGAKAALAELGHVLTN